MDAKGLTFSANEMEFLAEDELINIVPRFEMKQKLRFIQGDYGPFKPLHVVKVPLWLAVQLKKSKKCQIKPPQWMEIDDLTDRLKQEQTDKEFNQMPYHYQQIAAVLLQCASDDITNPEKVRTLLADITDVRNSKIKAGLTNIQQDVSYVRLTNITAMELNQIRDFSLQSLNHFHSLHNSSSIPLDDFDHHSTDDSSRVETMSQTSTPSKNSQSLSQSSPATPFTPVTASNKRRQSFASPASSSATPDRDTPSSVSKSRRR